MRTFAKPRLVLAGLLTLPALAALPAQAGAAPVAPRWHIAFRSFPTVLIPGSVAEGSGTNAVPQYSAVITNVGAGEASGKTTVAVTLPPGVALASGLEGVIIAREEEESCHSPSAEEVVCEIESDLPSGFPLVVAIPLEVAASAPSPAESRLEVSGGGAAPVSATLSSEVAATPPPFDFLEGPLGLFGGAFTADGLDARPAGSHPYSVLLEQNFNAWTAPYMRPIEDLRDLELRLPHGFTINPQAMSERCTEAELAAVSYVPNPPGGCGRASHVGNVTIETTVSGPQPLLLPLYDMEPPPGVAAELGFNVLGTLVHIQGGLDGAFHLTGGGREILARYAVLGIRVELWGNPADSGHDETRHGKGCGEGCPLSSGEANTAPLVTMPTSCGDALSLGATAVSWEGSVASRQTFFSDLEGGPLEMSGCNALAFGPTIESKATTSAAEAPSGLEFAIHQPQDESIEGRSTARLKNVKVTLPEGMALNPAAANGLDACTEEQMDYAPEGPKVQFTTEPQHCPPASKVGTLTVNTPLLGHELPGAVYVAKPFANPFGSLLSIYLAIEDEESGVIAKLAGRVQPDPQTGQLTATFAENPDLPLEDIHVHFFGGEHGTLTTPLGCGSHTTVATLTPWSAPQGAPVSPTDSFGTSVGCSASEAAAPKTTGFTAGTVSPLAGAYSPFVLRLSRPDGSQHITGIETMLPEGLVGKLAGIPYCPESAIAQAKGREEPEAGRLEQKDPSCPSASEVGTVQVTAGSGPDPLPVSGHAYWAGPYKGAPLSMAVIVPAVAGPFDLGTVVDRVALYVGEYDARIHAVADPLPTVRQGIPIDVRSIELKLSRPSFTLNPTSCEAKAIEAQVTMQTGQSSALKNRFQVGECGRLAFNPSLKLSLKGATKKTGHPALKAVVTYPKKGEYANIARAQVSLPHSEFLDQGNIAKACTKVVLAAQACPATSIYGKVKAWTPLLEKPLEGPVYLVGGYGYKLPALVAELNGQVRLLLVGKVDTGKSKGIRNTFEAAPDAPVSRFVLEMRGGKKYGLLENSENLCSKKQKAGASFTAHNSRVQTYSVKIANSCKVKHKRHKKHKRAK